MQRSPCRRALCCHREAGDLIGRGKRPPLAKAPRRPPRRSQSPPDAKWRKLICAQWVEGWQEKAGQHDPITGLGLEVCLNVLRKPGLDFLVNIRAGNVEMGLHPLQADIGYEQHADRLGRCAVRQLDAILRPFRNSGEVRREFSKKSRGRPLRRPTPEDISNSFGSWLGQLRSAPAAFRARHGSVQQFAVGA